VESDLYYALSALLLTIRMIYVHDELKIQDLKDAIRLLQGSEIAKMRAEIIKIIDGARMPAPLGIG
jgi:hypothetical protein